MASYLVVVVVTDPDEEVARTVAESIAEMAATGAEMSSGGGETYVSDPALVVRSD